MYRNRFNYVWRIVATGFCFTGFGLGGLLLAIVVIPLCVIIVRDKNKRQIRAQKILRASFQFFVWMLQAVGVITLEVTGKKYLESSEGRLIIANHPTLIDVVILVSLVPRAQCVIKHELWQNPFLRHIVQSMQYIRNDLPSEIFIEACRKAVNEGSTIIMFPEGRRARAGEILRFKRGFANIATILNSNIQPVTITCFPHMLAKNQPWYRVPSSPGHYTISAHPPLDIKPFLDYRSRAIGARKLVSFLEAYFARKLNHERA